jgi:hypothetical protein
MNTSTGPARPRPVPGAARRRVLESFLAVFLLALSAIGIVPAAAAAASSTRQATGPTKGLWQPVKGKPAGSHDGHQADIHARHLQTFTLDRQGMAAFLVKAPSESTVAVSPPLELSLPAPDGVFQRFAVQESPIMEAGLARLHRDIKTYSGKGVDDPTATIRFDLTPLGFHASVRGQQGSWYIDPFYHLDQSL